MSPRRALLAGLALLGGCESAALPPRQSADVYEFRLPTQPPLVLRWPSGATVRVYVAGGDVGTQASALEAAFERGAAEWNRQALFGEFRLVGTTDLGQADVVLRWAGQPSPVVLSQCEPAGTRAVTTFCAEDGDPVNGLAVFPRADGEPGRVKMVVTILSSQLTIPGRVDQLVTHELGHVLGIARHSDDARDLMYGGDLVTAAPSRRDLATLRVLYQTRPEALP